MVWIRKKRAKFELHCSHLQPPEGKNQDIFETEMVSLCANRVACLRPRKNCLQSWQRLTTFPTSGPWLAWDVRFPEKLIKLQKMARNKRNTMKKFGRKPPAPQKICGHAAASMGTVWAEAANTLEADRSQGKDTHPVQVRL